SRFQVRHGRKAGGAEPSDFPFLSATRPECVPCFGTLQRYLRRGTMLSTQRWFVEMPCIGHRDQGVYVPIKRKGGTLLCSTLKRWRWRRPFQPAWFLPCHRQVKPCRNPCQ